MSSIRLRSNFSVLSRLSEFSSIPGVLNHPVLMVKCAKRMSQSICKATELINQVVFILWNPKEIAEAYDFVLRFQASWWDERYEGIRDLERKPSFLVQQITKLWAPSQYWVSNQNSVPQVEYTNKCHGMSEKYLYRQTLFWFMRHDQEPSGCWRGDLYTAFDWLLVIMTHEPDRSWLHEHFFGDACVTRGYTTMSWHHFILKSKSVPNEQCDYTRKMLKYACFTHRVNTRITWPNVG